MSNYKNDETAQIKMYRSPVISGNNKNIWYNHFKNNKQKELSKMKKKVVKKLWK